MSDNTFTALQSQSGPSFKFANDPPNYNLLSNPDYSMAFRYVPLIYSQTEDED